LTANREARKAEDDGGVAAEGDGDLAAGDGGNRLAPRVLGLPQPAGEPRGEERAMSVRPMRPVELIELLDRERWRLR